MCKKSLFTKNEYFKKNMLVLENVYAAQMILKGFFAFLYF